jgi:hypothetical protein
MGFGVLWKGFAEVHDSRASGGVEMYRYILVGGTSDVR